MDRDGQALWRDFCAAVSEASFEALYDTYRSLIWTLCWRILGNEDDARDAFQSAWTRLYVYARNGGAAAADEPVAALAYRFAVREADALKKRRLRHGRREIAMDEWPDVASNSVPADEMAAASERRAKLEAIVSLLPDKYRLPIQLHYLHGMTQLQIADMMKIPRATVAARLARGVRKLMPLAERAGLGNIAGALAVVAAAGTLLVPPKALAAATVYLQIQAALTAVGVGATIAGASALGSKTIFGLTALKAKLALVSSLLLVAATTVVGIHYYHRAQARRPAVAAVARPVATVRPAMEPPEPAVSPAAAVTLVASATPAARPAATPTPTGPLRAIRVAAIWADTRHGAQGSTVSMQVATTEAGGAFPFNARADTFGMATLNIPESWQRARVRVQNPDALTVSREFDPARPAQPIVIALTRCGRLYGTVRLGDGRPAADAEVRAQGASAIRTARTEADGSYELGRVPAGPVRVTAVRQNLRSDVREPAGRPATMFAGRRTGPIDLTLEPGLTVSGIVTAAQTGRPVAGAKVSSGVGPVAVTDAEGRYTAEGLPPTRVALVARAQGFGGKARMVAPTTGARTRCDFALDPGGRVEALVLDERGQPVAGARIVPLYNRSFQLNDMSNTFKTDAAGRATLGDLATDQGLYLAASKPGAGNISRNVDFAPGALTAASTLILKKDLSPPGFIVGMVADQDGNPLAGINLYRGYFDTGDAANPHATTDENGRYRIQTDNSHELPLTAYGKGWGSESRAAFRPGSQERPAQVDFVLRPGHWLAGVVVDEKGRPLGDIRIVMTAGVNNSLPNALQTTNAAGRFRAEDLPAGLIHLQIGGRDILGQYRTVPVDKEARIVIEPTGAIRGRVLDRETGRPVEAFTIRCGGNYLDASFQASGQVFSDPEGKFELTGLKQGDRYDLLIESRGYASHTERTVTAAAVDAAGETAIALARGTPLRGVLLDAASGRPIAGAVVVYGKPHDDSYVFWNHLSDPGANGNIQTLARTTTAADGRFELNVEDAGQMLWIASRNHKGMILAQAERQTYLRDGELVIPVAAGAQLKGRVFLDGTIQPQADMHLMRMPTGPNGPTVDFGTIYADESGAFAIGGLDPGFYILDGPTRWKNSQGTNAYRRRVEIKRDETRQADLGGDLGNSLLAGAVLDNGTPVSNGLIRLQPLFEWDYQTIVGYTDENGVFAIDGLLPGKYGAEVVRYGWDGPRAFLNETVEVGANTTAHNFEKIDRAAGPGTANR